MIIMIASLIISLYATTGVVTETNTTTNTVTFADFNGNEYSFYGVEDWEEGDIVSAIMSDNGTETILDDEIVSVRYSGYIQ